MKLNKVVIGIGSNINPDKNVERAKYAIAQTHKLVKTSRFVKTKPVGYEDQDSFINGALLIETYMDIATIKSWLKGLEIRLGRIKTDNKNGPRTIDLDVLLWNGTVIDRDVYEREFLQISIKELLPDAPLMHSA